MSDLRTRIAAAISDVRIQRDGQAYEMADAVIRELGLRQERQQGPYKFLYRYVTGFMSDE
jgi:hypothetical protein